MTESLAVFGSNQAEFGGCWAAHSKIYGGSRSIWTQYVTGLAVHHNEIHGMWDADGHSGPSNLVSPKPLRETPR